MLIITLSQCRWHRDIDLTGRLIKVAFTTLTTGGVAPQVMASTFASVSAMLVYGQASPTRIDTHEPVTDPARVL